MINVRNVAVKHSSKMSTRDSFILEKYPGHVKKSSSKHNSKMDQPGLTLSWSGLSVYCVKKSSSLLKTRISTKNLVNNVTGVAKAGTLTAVMGASGAGKTTLLSALAQRNNGGLVVEGDVRVNGHIIGSRIRKLSAFLYQKDIFFPSLTVYEHLVFYARLKLDRRLSKAEIKDKVFEILRQVGLLNVAHRQIGTSGDHYQIFLSGGERRRLSFATELLSDPDLFFCDEVTSGLDSYSTLNLITTMKEMAASHQKTIICAIHQPSSELVDLFDSLIILAESRTAFIGNARAGVEFFKEQGYQCPRNYNPADFFIKILAVTGDDEQNSRKRIKNICDAYVSSKTAQSIDMFVDDEISNRRNELQFKKGHATSDIKHVTWLTRLLLLTYRLQVDVFRNKQYIVMRLVQKTVVGLMMGLLYSGSLTQDQPGIQAWEGFFFSLGLQNVASAIFTCISKFQKQFPLFVREYEDRLVGSLQFYSAMILAWLPIVVFESFLVTTPFYLLAGAYMSLPVFLDTLYIGAVASAVSLLCGSCFAASIQSFEICTFILSELLTILNILSGFYMNLRSVPVYLKLFELISWQRYIMELLSVIHIQASTTFSCTNNTVIDLPCFRTGEEVLDNYGYSLDRAAWDYMAMYSLIFLFYVVGYAFFLRRIIKLTTV